MLRFTEGYECTGYYRSMEEALEKLIVKCRRLCWSTSGFGHEWHRGHSPQEVIRICCF